MKMGVRFFPIIALFFLILTPLSHIVGLLMDNSEVSVVNNAGMSAMGMIICYLFYFKQNFFIRIIMDQ